MKGVDLDFYPGEIHAVCGGNGSGKSTLIKILSGVYQGDEGGTIRFDDDTVESSDTSPSVAHKHGVRVVHQDLGVFGPLSVAENMVIDRGYPRGFGGRIRWNSLHRTAQSLIDEFEIQATPTTKLEELSLATWTEVAIARALRDRQNLHSGLLILDEPTAALPIHEVQTMLDALRRLARSGQSILYVSHRLDEVLTIADKVSVLRDGSLVGTYPARDLTESRLIELMMGRAVVESVRRQYAGESGEPVLEVQDLRGGPLRGVSFQLNRGEILGIAGLMGSGRTSVLQSIFGAVQPAGGRIEIEGSRHAPTNVAEAIARGIALVPENRARDGVFPDQSVAQNMSIGVIRKYWRKLRIATRRISADSKALIDQYNVKTPSSRAVISSLSGGNQQKVILARWLRRKPRILLLDEPTQGVDVGARSDIYRMIREATDAGASAILVASDYEELSKVADRVLVLRHGAVYAEVTGEDINSHKLTELSYFSS